MNLKEYRVIKDKWESSFGRIERLSGAAESEILEMSAQEAK